MSFFRKFGEDLKHAGSSIRRASRGAAGGLQRVGEDVGRGIDRAGKEVGKAGHEVGHALKEAGKETGKVLETVVKEPARIVKDLIDVEVDIITNVTLNLSRALETHTWVSAKYEDHVVKARSELGKLVSEGFKEKVRRAICDALDGSLGSLRGQLPDLSKQLLSKVPTDAPFHGELSESLRERMHSSSWVARFLGHDRLALGSEFLLNDLLESLIGRLLQRERLHRDILDLAAKQGLMSGNLLDLFPDLRGVFLQAIEDECPGARRPLEESLDAFSSQEFWDARIPERNKVTLSSKFTLQELIERTCAALTEEDVREMRPWLRKQGGVLSDILPSSGVLLFARPALEALLPGVLARQQSFFEWTHEFMGAMTVSVAYPKQTSEVFGFDITFDFKHVVAQITTDLFRGLPRSLDFDAGLLGPVDVNLEYPDAGDAGISLQVSLRGKQFHEVIEEAVQQNREQIASAIPLKVVRFATSTADKDYNGAVWTCANKIQIGLKVVGIRNEGALSP